MKKYLYIAASLLLTITMQAQDRPMPKQGPAPSINIKKPVTFVLENGLKVLVVENNKLPRVSYNLTLDNTPFAEGSKKGVTDLVSSMIGNATESISKDKFNEEIDFLGANINFYESGASANGLSRYSARILELLADGALNPLFTQEDFDAERAKLIEGLKSDEKSASAIAGRVQNVLTYGKEHYNGEFTSEETLKNVKAGYIGKFVMDIEKPATVARYALQTKTQGLPADFYENYIKNINAVTADDILRVSKKYFLAENLRIVVVSKGADVVPGLEKLNIPIFYFDKYGNKVEKPIAKTVSADVTAKSVLDKYIAAIGGQKAISDVKSIMTTSSGTVQGMALEMTTKVTSSNKLAVEMKAMGTTMMKQVVNENGAYMVQQGQRKDFTGDDLKEMQAGAVPFEELTLANNKDITLGTVENINGTDAYAVKNGKSTYYFDVKTGLKIAEAKELEQGGQKMTQMTYYSDYKEVKGIKVPHKTTLNIGVELELTTSDVKINEGVTDEDFK